MAGFSQRPNSGHHMNPTTLDLSTDSAWEEWGRRDAYFGVITNPRFRSSELTERTRQEFFESGRWHVRYVMEVIRKHLHPDFVPSRILDFGCGVGRVLLPFAALAHEVVGLDVSPSMLLEARRNCEQHSIANVVLLVSDDSLSSLSGGFDLIHSCIVFQHIPLERGRLIFARLLQHMSSGGVAAIQLTYSKSHFAETFGIAPDGPKPIHSPLQPKSNNADPEIQMNPYDMNSILFMLQENKVAQFYTEFTDHGGELGVFLFFRKPV
jgi:2-polyprenyl-3-methyl-5-hydroxy-6-metoxy-1,4-benzoquinol methylase